MNTLSPQAQKVIADYFSLPFHKGPQGVRVAYYNNQRIKLRAAIRVLGGKGTPHEIAEEVHLFTLREKRTLHTMTTEEARVYIIDHKIGIDCSGFFYHVMNAECLAQTGRTLRSSIRFPFIKNPLRRLIAAIRPAENTGVSTLSHPDNSSAVALNDAQPGDFISLMGNGAPFRNHLLLIERVERGNDDSNTTLPATLHYVHSYQKSSDGKYGHGVRRGTITITNTHADLLAQTWTEEGKTGVENEVYGKAVEAPHLSLRRLNVLNRGEIFKKSA